MAASIEAQQVETYDLASRRAKKAGRVVILSHFNYVRQPQLTRVGTHKDELELFQVFNTLHFEISCHRDLTEKQIQEKLEYYSNEDYTDYGCFILVVLTHGEDNGRLCASDKSYHISDTWKPFMDCRTLYDKPKIFIYQACRASLNTAVQERHYVSFDADGSESIKPYTPDFLLAFSTMDGQLSNRNPQEGTWYIQTLCQQLYTWAGGKKDILQVLTEVNARLVREREKTDKNGQMTGQTPTFISFLHKRVITKFENVYGASTTVDLQNEVKRLKELLASISNITTTDQAAQQEQLTPEQRLEIAVDSGSGTISDFPETYDLPMQGGPAGVALIYHDEEFGNKAGQMNDTLTQLQFETTQTMTSQSLLTDIQTETSKPSFANAACLILTFITTLQESAMTDFNIKFIDIWNKLTVTNCPSMASKPKILFFVNLDKTKDCDNAVDCPTGMTNKSEYANDHSDFIIFYGYGRTIFESLITELSSCNSNAQDAVHLMTNVMKCVTSSNTGYLSHFESTLTRTLLLGAHRDTSASATKQPPRFVNIRPPAIKQTVKQQEPKPNQRYLDAQEQLKRVMTPNPKENPVVTLHNRLLEKANNPHTFQGSVFEPRPQTSPTAAGSNVINSPNIVVNNGIIANSVHGAGLLGAYGQDVGEPVQLDAAQRRRQVELQKKLLKAQQDQLLQDQIMNIFRK